MNPLTVLDKVFTHLSLEDLKIARLVNSAWSQESTITLRKHIANISVSTHAALRALISLSKLSHTVPFTKFNFSSHFFSLPNCGPGFIQFLSILAPDLESISITLDKDSELLPLIDSKPLFPKLTQVTFTGHGLDSSEFPAILKTLLCSSPRLESLSLMMDQDCRNTVKHLFRYMAENREITCKNLESLEIYVPVGDEEIANLCRIGFHLKTLKCDFHRSCFLQESFKSFLNGQSSSLEYLMFDNYFGNSCYSVAFPLEMSSVKTLKIDGKSELSSKEVTFLPFNYAKQLPNLVKLVLGGSVEFNKCWKIFFPEDVIVPGLRQLRLKARYIDPAWIERAGVIFPNLEQLYFSLTPKNEACSKIVFNAFTNVRKLTIYFHPDTRNVDHLLTGMSEGDCEEMRESKEFIEKRTDVGLAKMKSLKTLRFKQDRKSEIPHISEVSVTHCLLLMKNLQTVTMPSFQISPDVLAKLSAQVHLNLI